MGLWPLHATVSALIRWTVPVPTPNATAICRRRPSIVISTSQRRLYLVMAGHQALRYGIGVGREGFIWSGTSEISMKRQWPDWTPPDDMLRRKPELPRHMAGGLANPVGAR